MNDLPIDQDRDEPSIAANRYPTPPSNTPLPSLSSSQAANLEMTPYFYGHCAYTGWAFRGEESGEPLAIEPRPLPTDLSTSLESQNTDDLWPSAFDSVSSAGSSYYNLNSNDIIEHEIWDLPLSTELPDDERYHDLSSSIQHPCHKRNFETSISENSPGRKSRPIRVSSTSDVHHIRSQSSSSSENQALPKRTYNCIGEQSKSLATQITEPAANIDSIDKEPESKLLAKSLHSVVERKYRDNINTKITQLDRVLFDTHCPDGQPNNPKADKPPQKTTKAEVLNGAMRYIKQAELQSEARIKEIDFLRLRVVALEKLVNYADIAIGK